MHKNSSLLSAWVSRSQSKQIDWSNWDQSCWSICMRCWELSHGLGFIRPSTLRRWMPLSCLNVSWDKLGTYVLNIGFWEEEINNKLGDYKLSLLCIVAEQDQIPNTQAMGFINAQWHVKCVLWDWKDMSACSSTEKLKTVECSIDYHSLICWFTPCPVESVLAFHLPKAWTDTYVVLTKLNAGNPWPWLI